MILKFNTRLQRKVGESITVLGMKALDRMPPGLGRRIELFFEKREPGRLNVVPYP